MSKRRSASKKTLNTPLQLWWQNVHDEIWGQFVMNWTVYGLRVVHTVLMILFPVLAGLPNVIPPPTVPEGTPIPKVSCRLEVPSLERGEAQISKDTKCTDFEIHVIVHPATVVPTTTVVVTATTVPSSFAVTSTPSSEALVTRKKCLRLDEPIYSETYRTQPGDNLSCIAYRSSISLEKLLTANPAYRTNPHYIRDGILLEIPR